MKLNDFRREGPTLVHCQAGLNRSSLVAGASLILGGRFTPDEAIDYLRANRSKAVLCNQSFEEYLRDFDVTPV
jgi:protein-tyrosine phosphatase